MKTFVLMISKTFPKTHPIAGEPTYFAEKIARVEKIHTIRENYELWRKRVVEVQNGLAEISLRQWSGLPYKSIQVEIGRLTQKDEIGIQWVYMNDALVSLNKVRIRSEPAMRAEFICAFDLAKNDGLTFHAFCDWFNLSKQRYITGGIIHFTGFRY
jgi:hypothetical protein